jgi:hypothetical protein
MARAGKCARIEPVSVYNVEEPKSYVPSKKGGISHVTTILVYIIAELWVGHLVVFRRIDADGIASGRAHQSAIDH